jgi:hypothetical protein
MACINLTNTEYNRLDGITKKYVDWRLCTFTGSGTSSQGPQGTTGPAGPVGATGPTGSVGATGPQGIQGATGPQGIQGVTGSIGETGSTGLVGNDGSNSGRWFFDDGSISPANPGNKLFITDNTSLGSVNNISISSLDYNNVDYQNWLDLADTLFGLGNPFYLQVTEVNNNSIIGLYSVNNITSNSGYADFVVTNLVANGNLSVGGTTSYTISWIYGGLDGSIGATGPAGSIGATGPQGIQGVTGSTGATGPQGIQGATGSTGATGPGLQYLIFVEEKADLPTPVSNVINLVDEYTYFFTTEVDLTGDRLQAGQNTTILGGSSENCRIKSTGLTSTLALLSSSYSIPMRNIALEAERVLNLDTGSASSSYAIDWFGVNFVDSVTVGRIANYSNFIMTDCALLNSANMSFDGTFGTIGFANSLFSGRAAQTTIKVEPTANITRRFRMIYSSLVAFGGATAIHFSASATVSNDAYILDTINFSGGATYLEGVTQSSPKALILNCVGIRNTSNVGHYFMQGNATATTVGVGNQNVWFKAAGTTTVGIGNSPRWSTATTNRLTYVGTLTGDFILTAVGAIQTTANNITLTVGVAKNGVIQTESAIAVRAVTANQPFNFSVQDLIEVEVNDYFEIFVRNESGTQNITVSDLNVIIQKITG